MANPLTVFVVIPFFSCMHSITKEYLFQLVESMNFLDDGQDQQNEILRLTKFLSDSLPS